MAWVGYHDTHRTIQTIDKHLRGARFLAMYHRQPVILCAAHPTEICGTEWSDGISIFIDNTLIQTFSFKKTRLHIEYHGFPNQTIPIDQNGFLVGNGHFNIHHPYLPSKRYILNQHAALYPAR